MKRPSSTSSSDASAPDIPPATRKPGLLRWFAGILVVAAMAVAAQYAIDAFTPHPDPGWTAKHMPDQCFKTLVYLGDSINASFAHDDEDPQSLATLISIAADHHVGAVALGGFDMLLFRDYVKAMRKCLDPEDPRTWILTVNLANYREDGRTPYVRNKNMINAMLEMYHRTRRAFARPMQVFRCPPVRASLREEEDLHRPVVWQGKRIGIKKDFDDALFKVEDVTDDLRRKNVILRYAQPMTRGNLALKATTEAARILRAHGQRAIFCIVPCDVERCDALLDGALSPILDQKAAQARAAAEAGGGEVLDLHSAFPHDWFVPDQYPNEHLRNPGREALASAIVSFIATNVPAGSPL
jgi:hypothetical protein